MEQALDIIELDARNPGADRAADVLETGGMIVLPQGGFNLRAEDRAFLDPAILSQAKNVSFDPATGALGGVDVRHAAVQGSGRDRLAALMRRFSVQAAALLAELASGW